MSDVLLAAVACRYLMPAVVFFFSISTLMPVAFVNALPTVTVVSGG